MTVADNLRSIASEARPIIKASLATAEIIASFRDTAKEQGINWSQLKALLVAEARDNEDGGTRLKELAEKHDIALTYADMLASNVAERNKTRTQSSKPIPQPVSPEFTQGSDGEGAALKAPHLDGRSESDGNAGLPAPSTTPNLGSVEEQMAALYGPDADIKIVVHRPARIKEPEAVVASVEPVCSSAPDGNPRHAGSPIQEPAVSSAVDGSHIPQPPSASRLPSPLSESDPQDDIRVQPFYRPLSVVRA